MKTLIMMIGLPRSGKTTISNLLRDSGIPRICPDDLRAMVHGKPFLPQWESLVWGTAEIMVTDALRTHDKVILDATNLLERNRGVWSRLLGIQFSKSEIKYIYVDTPASVCIARAQQNNQDYLIPVIERMDREKQIPNVAGALNPNVFYWRDYLAEKEKAV